jgi:hypothetical protein
VKAAVATASRHGDEVEPANRLSGSRTSLAHLGRFGHQEVRSAEAHLRLAPRMGERNEHFLSGVLPLPHGVLHHRVAAGVPTSHQ